MNNENFINNSEAGNKLEASFEVGEFLCYTDLEEGTQSINRVDSIITTENDIEYSGQRFNEDGLERYWSSTEQIMSPIRFAPIPSKQAQQQVREWGYTI